MLYATTSRLFFRFLRKDTGTEHARLEAFFAECDDVAVELRQQESTLRDCVRRDARREIESLVVAVRQRKETETFVYGRVWSHGPACSLRQICYRSRWMPDLASYKYDLLGLYACLVARIMLGLLEKRIIMRTIYKQAKLVRNMTLWELRLLRTLIIQLQKVAASDQDYIALLLVKLCICSGRKTPGIYTVRMPLRPPGEPGFHCRTEEERYEIMGRLRLDFATEIVDMPVDAQICCDVGSAA